MKDTKQAILDAAQDLFAQNGFDATSTREIALKADVNIAMLSYYFNSKLNLLKEIIDQKMAKSWGDVIEKMDYEDMDYWATLDQLIDNFINKIFNNSTFHCMMFRETTMNSREDITELWYTYLKKNHELFVRFLRSGHKKGVFRKVDEELTLLTIISVISRLVMSQPIWERLMQRETKMPVLSEAFKKRLKKHLSEMMRAHLKNEKE